MMATYYEEMSGKIINAKFGMALTIIVRKTDISISVQVGVHFDPFCILPGI